MRILDDRDRFTAIILWLPVNSYNLKPKIQLHFMAQNDEGALFTLDPIHTFYE